MKNILRIFGRDLKKLFTNPVAMVIIGGLMVLPSLYAWFNIKASWDPYGSTAGIKVAVVNKDAGGTVEDKETNVGNEVVDKLKDNTKLGWNFVTEEEAREGVQKGKYYAAIIFPEEFTKQTISIMDNIVVRPKLEYIVNQKSNAIAPKITDKGVNTVKSEIDTNIVETVDSIIFKTLNESGIKIADSKNDIIKLVNGIIDINNRMPEIEDAVNKADEQSKKADEMVLKAQEALPLVKDTLSTATNLLNTTKSALQKSKDALSKVSPVIKEDLQFANGLLSGVQDISKSVMNIQGSIEKNVDKNAIIKSYNDMSTKIGDAKSRINNMLNNLNTLAQKSDKVKPLIDKLQTLNTKLDNANNIVNDIKNEIGTKNFIDKNKVQQLSDLAKSNSDLVSDILNKYDSEYVPKINGAIDDMIHISDNGSQMVADATGAMPDVEKALKDLDSDLKTAMPDIAQLKADFPTIKEKIGKVASKLSGLNDADKINKIIDMLTNDWKAVSDFLGSPVEIEQQNLFELPNYGSAMSPFYTTLAVWVGALLLVSLLTTTPHELKGTELKPYQKYFGKLLTFLFIGLIQSLILSIGDIYFLGCYVVDKPLFIGISILASVVFVIIVYTLVSIFGNAGKAIAIVFLVIQVAGSGGTFPIEVTPTFFKTVNPFLPFTHSINAMREAVAGVVWENLYTDLWKLCIYPVIAIVLALLLKGIVNKRMKKIDEALNKSGLLGH